MRSTRSFRRPFVLVAALAALAGCPPAEPQEGFRAVTFPAGFAFGTAVAQWQVEGDYSPDGPVDSNWSRWMAMGKGERGQTNPEGNGFYTQYEEEAARAAALGLDTFRLGVDWSRIEPAPGQYDEAELQHLEDVLDALRAEGLNPVLTLYHWTVPTWVQNPDPAAEGGVVDLMATTDREPVLTAWEGFVRTVITRVKDRVDVYTVLNEPFSMISAGYIGGVFPPGRILDIEGATQFGLTLMFMHAKAYDVIEELDDVDADGDGDPAFIGLTQTANAFYPYEEGNENEQFAVEHISYVFNDWVMIALTAGDVDVNLDGDSDDVDTVPPEGHYPELAGRLDFVGVQYYGPVVVKDDPLFRELHPLYGNPLLDARSYDDKLPHNGMGREIRAAGLRDTLDIYAKYQLPILLTENGTTTNARPVRDEEAGTVELAFQHDQAAMYLVEHLWEVGRALERGVDIRGYYHWTLSDNYEWVEGQDQRFGAYTVDFDAGGYPRTLNKMGEALRDIIDKRGIDEALWNEYVLERYPSDTRDQGGVTVSEPLVGPLAP